MSRKRRQNPEERALRLGTRMAAGSIGGRVESAAPFYNRAVGGVSPGGGVYEEITYTITGTLSVDPGEVRWYPPYDITVVEVRGSVNTAPSGASIKFDVNKNGTTIFTTQANRPTIASGSYTAVSGTPDVDSAEPGDYYQVDVDQIGSTTPGADATVTIKYQIGGLAGAQSGIGGDHGQLSGLGDDDHTQYQKESEKDVANGYAGLGSGGYVPTAELGSGSATSSTYLRGDQSWQTVAGVTYGTPALTFDTTNTNGSTSEAIRRDAQLALFDATSPTTQAFGDSAATGSAGKAARRDHKHAMPTAAITTSGLTQATGKLLGRNTASTGAVEEITLGTNLSFSGTTLNAASGGGATFGTPALTFDTTNTAGSTDEVIRRDAQLALFDATAPSTQAFGDSATVGSAGKAARRDHKHAMPTAAVTTSGLTQATGKLLGRSTASTGAIEEITLGTNLSFSGGTLNATGSGGGGSFVASDPIWDAKGDLAVGSASDAASRLAVGTDGYIPVADSSASVGIRWAIPSSTLYPLDVPPSSPHAKDDEFSGTSLDGKWTNPLTSASGQTNTLTVAKGYVVFEPATTGTSSTGKHVFGIQQTAPSGSFTLTAKIFDGLPAYDIRSGAFVGIAGGKGHVCGPFGHDQNVGVIGVTTISDTADWSSYDSYLNNVVGSASIQTWVKIVWDSGPGTLWFYYSQNGVFWNYVHSRGGMSQPDRIGLCIYSNSGAITAEHQFGAEWFRITEP